MIGDMSSWWFSALTTVLTFNRRAEFCDFARTSISGSESTSSKEPRLSTRPMPMFLVGSAESRLSPSMETSGASRSIKSLVSRLPLVIMEVVIPLFLA
ncbi:hypothetical protein D3C72_1766510 [compost metagenome]